MNKFIFSVLFFSQTYCIAQLLESGKTIQEYADYMDSKEYESDLYECSFANTSVQGRIVFGGVERIDKTDFSGLVDLLYYYTQYFYESDPRFSWRNEVRFAFTDVKFDFVTGENRTIARAHSPLRGDVRIIINIDLWEKLNSLERVWLFFHEYAHEAFALEHGEITLMYPLLPKDKLKDDWNLDDENIKGNVNSIYAKRRCRDITLLPYAPLKCNVSSDEFFKISKSNAYLHNAIIEFIHYLVGSGYKKSDKTFVSIKDNTYPLLKSSGKVAFPGNKINYIFPNNYFED